MLTMTPSAAELVNHAREEQGLPDHFCLRVFAAPSQDGTPVKLSFTEGPAEGDAVAETQGNRVFVSAELAEPLSDAVMDTTETPEGVGLVFRPQ